MPGGKIIGQEIRRLFHEYESNLTLEAMFAHDVGKLETALQTVEYEMSHQRDVSEFYHVIEDTKVPEVREWAAEILKKRKIVGIGIPLRPIYDTSISEPKATY